MKSAPIPAAVMALLAAAALSATAQQPATSRVEPLPLSTSYWRDPAFLRSFNGSYRIEARIEPNVTSDERGLLVEIQNLMAAGNRAEAIRRIEGSPLTAGSAALTFNLANLRFEEGLLDEAITAYRSAIGMLPAFRRAHRNLAVALVRKHDLEAALPHLTEAIRLGDADGATFGLLGYCRLQRGEWASALQAYRLAQLSEPDTPEWLAGIAQCLQNLNAPEEAAALLDEVIRQRPAEPSYAMLRATVLLDLGRDAEAAATLELPHRLDTLPPDARLLLADLHMRHGRIVPARERLQAAFASDTPENPDDAPADTTAPDPERVASFAASALHHRQWDLARDALDLAAGDDAPPRSLAILRARLLIESGEDPAAGESLLREILAADPDSPRALLALARHLATPPDAPATTLDEALLLLDRAATHDFAAAEAHLESARLRVRLRQYPEAIEAIDRAIQLDPRAELRAYRESLAALADAAN